MAEENSLSPLTGLRPQGSNSRPSVTTGDMENYDFGMSPEDMMVLDQYRQQQQAPSTGALGTQTYYPGYQPGGATGHYSGSVIGSTSLFGGGGALVPQGMFDAQDAAVNRAATTRAKEVDDFRKQFSKAPTSKLTNINDNLTKEYFKHQQDSWNKALKKANGDAKLATQLLKNDPNFFAKTKSYEDAAKLGDSIVEKNAQDELDIRTGKFNPTPSYKASRERLFRALDPNHPEFKNLANIFQTMQVERNFSDSLDEVMKRDFATKIGKSGVDLKDPEFIKEWESSEKKFTPQQQENYAKILSENHFNGSDYFNYDRILKNVKASTAGVETDSKTNVTQKREDNSKDLDYSDAAPQTSTATNMTTQTAEGAEMVTGSVFGENAYKTNAVHEAKEISIPISENMVDTQGKKISEKSGHVRGTIAGIQNGYYDKIAKRFLTPEEVVKYKSSDVKNHNIVAKTVAVMNVKPSAADAGNTNKQNTVFVDANEIKGKFKNPKKKDGQRDFDDLIEENQKLADETNKANHAPAAATVAQPAKKIIKASDIPAKAAAAGYSVAEYKKLLQEKGVTIQ